MHQSRWLQELYIRLRPWRWQIALALLLTLFNAGVSLLPPLFIGKIIDEAIADSDTILLIGFSMVIFLAQISLSLLAQVRQFMLSAVVLKLTRNLRLDVFRKLLHTRTEFFTTTPRGDILQRCIDDTQSIQTFSLETIPKFLQELAMAVTAFVVISALYWPIAVLMLGVYAMFLLPLRSFGAAQRTVSRDLSLHNSNLKQLVMEKLESLRVIKTFRTEEVEQQEIRHVQSKWLMMVRRRYVTDNLFRTLPRVMDAFAPAVVFTIGGWKVFTGDLTVGNLVTITGFLPALNAPIRSFSETFLALKDISGRMERVVEYLDLPVEPGLEPGLRGIESIQGKVEFQAVSYQVGDKVILDKVSFYVQPGEYVALVGFSGAGKSTVLKLLARMIEPTAGLIELDGVPLTSLEATSLRRRLGIVAQNTFLFNDTLWNNLCYLVDATEADVQAVVESVGADVFIQELPDGTHTQLGERGMALSGGQRQRIGIARALLGRYDLLLLDEATSALDRQSERQVLGAIRAAMPSKTRLVVAHRLDTVLDADRILVFDQGKLVEAGTHASLLVQDGLYKQLWEASNQSEEGEMCAVEVNI